MTMDAKELLREAVTFHKCRMRLSRVITKKDLLGESSYIQDEFISKVVAAEDYVLIEAIKEAVDNGLIGGAFIIDRNLIQELFNRMEPRIVYYELHGPGVCPCCGKEIYRGHNEKYCGFCGQALAWEITP